MEKANKKPPERGRWAVEVSSDGVNAAGALHSHFVSVLVLYSKNVTLSSWNFRIGDLASASGFVRDCGFVFANVPQTREKKDNVTDLSDQTRNRKPMNRKLVFGSRLRRLPAPEGCKPCSD
jgi:hypothetical protein